MKRLLGLLLISMLSIGADAKHPEDFNTAMELIHAYNGQGDEQNK
jgi:hypothetical protein